MSGISSKALKPNYSENRRKYNGGSQLQNKEFTDGTGLELYTTNYRMYDPQIGRFNQIDPFAEVNEDASTYTYANNNPILFNDPLGLLSDSSHPQNLTPVTVNPQKKNNGGNNVANLLPLLHTKAASDNVSTGIRPVNLQDIRFLTGEQANAGFKEPPFPRNSTVTEYRTTRPLRLVRVSNSKINGARGGWLVDAKSIRGMSPQDIKQNLAIENEPDQIGEVEVPTGTTVRVGPVGANGFGPGNIRIMQYQIISRIPNESFFTPVPLQPPPQTPIEPIEPIDPIEPIEPIEPIDPIIP